MRVSPKAQEQLRRARLLLMQGNTVGASQRVEKILSEIPNFPDAQSVRARIRLRENRITEAFADARQALAEDPQLTNAYFVLGEILNHEHRYAEALSILDHCVALAPNVWPCHYERARALVGTDQVASALQEIERAAELGGLKEEPGGIYYLRGSVHLLLNDTASAIEDFEAFLRICPSGQLAEGVRFKLENALAGQSKSVRVRFGPFPDW